MDTNGNTKELIKDLCSRLPYGVKISIPELWTSEKKIEVLNEIFKGDDGEFRCNDSGMLIKHVKSYLFPLSSMTEEQLPYYITTLKYSEETRGMVETPNSFDWLNKNHFDYRGLIEKGLAIDATGLNIY